eukprot:TRINITY_DN10118_c0_g1_i3.p1 TRINITY_DN10118_c0_g1~~TRINITY_DN10118_c0_g1_i3.p1  ORF type:complete len:105 (-),score=28.65 TRINITY_DN10118_c0_g1_i3:153-467(-)
MELGPSTSITNGDGDMMMSSPSPSSSGLNTSVGGGLTPSSQQRKRSSVPRLPGDPNSMLEKKSRKKSPIWESFSPIEGGVRCIVCNKLFSKSTSTTSLKYHLDH